MLAVLFNQDSKVQILGGHLVGFLKMWLVKVLFCAPMLLMKGVWGRGRGGGSLPL